MGGFVGKSTGLRGALVEIEVVDHVPQNRLVLANVRARVPPTVRLRVESCTAEEVILDELEVWRRCSMSAWSM